MNILALSVLIMKTVPNMSHFLLSKDEDFKGRIRFVEKLKSDEILRWFEKYDFLDFSSCPWIFFEVIETFYFLENCEKDDQNVYEITEMKVYSCENDWNMERNL